MGPAINVFPFPRAQALPGADGARLLLDGREHVFYHFGAGFTRPFLFPILGPSGRELTRMGHPNPVGHEHHKSVWFGHEDVAGVNFWIDRPGAGAAIRHLRVLAYEDGPDWAALAADLSWELDEKPKLRQRLFIGIEPAERGGFALDLQSRFEPPDGAPVSLGRTNFGFLGVRVAKTVSEQFGGGRLTNAEGKTGENALFGRRARWVDYAGPVAPGVVEGIAYLDHPDNPRHPTHWHVRRDGWMEAAFCLAEPYGVAADHPLDLRYRLFVHEGPADLDQIEAAWERFASAPVYEFTPPARGRQPAIRREHGEG